MLFSPQKFRVNNGGIFWFSNQILESLYVLDIEGTEITSEIFMYITKNATLLREFYIGNTYIDNNLMLLQSHQVKSKKITHLCVYNLDLNLDSLNFIDEALPNLKEIYLNNQLYAQVKLDNNLSINLLSKLKVKDIKESRTCLHYLDHACDKYRD